MIIPLRDNAPKGAEPVVTVCIMLTCVLVFGLQLIYHGGFVQSLETWGEVPTRILAGGSIPGTHISAYWTWLTSMFMHGGVMHLLGNMIVLWLFGDNVEWLMGRFRYLLFYIICGVLANVATTYLGYESDMPGIGASGAIAGVMAAYLCFYPRARVTSLMWISPFSFMHLGTGEWGFVTRNISALWFIGGWLLWELIFGGFLLNSGEHMNFGTFAHLSGALVGGGLVWLLAIPKRRPDPDHPVVTAEFTAAVWGDSGDAGEGELIRDLGETTPERLARLHPADIAAAIHDYRAEDLIESNDYEAAIRHCREMLEIARRLGEHDRVVGYEVLIEQLQKRPHPADMSVGI